MRRARRTRNSTLRRILQRQLTYGQVTSILRAADGQPVEVPDPSLVERCWLSPEGTLTPESEKLIRDVRRHGADHWAGDDEEQALGIRRTTQTLRGSR